MLVVAFSFKDLLIHGGEADFQVPIGYQGGLFVLHIEMTRFLSNAAGTEIETPITIGVWSTHEESMVEVLSGTDGGAHFDLFLMGLLIHRLGSIFNVGAVFRREEPVNSWVTVGEAYPFHLCLNGIPAHG